MELHKRWLNVLLAFETIALVLVLGLGIFQYGISKTAGQSGEVNQDNADIGASESNQSTQEDTTEEDFLFSDEVMSLLGSMTLDDKVAQLFVTTPEAITGANQVTVAGNMSEDAFQTYPVGGILFSGRNYIGDQQFKELIDGYQGFSMSVLQTGLFVFADGVSDNARLQGVNRSLSDFKTVSSFENDAVASERDNMGEDMQIICCDLSAESIASSYEDGEAAVAALKAGVDLLYHPADFKEAYAAVLEAARTEEIDLDVLDQAVGRILTVKLR